MKYVPPYGISDPDAAYINGDPSIGRMGSIPPAAAFEHPMREIVSVITHSQLVPSDADLNQMMKGIRSQRMNYVEDTGSVNNLSVALDPPLSSYSPGLVLRVRVYNTNTGPATIDAGAGRVSIIRPTGAEMNPGDLPAAGMAELVYDGTRFQMINFGGAGGGGTGTITMVNVPYCVDSSATANQVVANFSPAVTSLVPGTMLLVKVANTNTAFATINVNGLGPMPIWAQGTTSTPNWPMLPSDIIAGDVHLFVYDGTRFWIYANTILTINTTFYISNNQQFSDAFVALNRKRIPPNVYVLFSLGQGTWGPLATQHPNSDQITISGTMKAAVPTFAEYAKTGNSAAARAADSANNIAMLRTRFGTEIHMSTSYIGSGITHSGGGMPTFKNFLITGDNVAQVVGWPQQAASPNSGASMRIQDSAVWGMCSTGLASIGNCVLNASNVVCCSGQYAFNTAMGGQMSLAACAAYGNAQYGVVVNRRSSCTMHALAAGDLPGSGLPPIVGCEITFNGLTGISSNTQSIVALDRATVVGNGGNGDLYANDGGQISGTVGSTYGSASPPVGTIGNAGGIITG